MQSKEWIFMETVNQYNLEHLPLCRNTVFFPKLKLPCSRCRTWENSTECCKAWKFIMWHARSVMLHNVVVIAIAIAFRRSLYLAAKQSITCQYTCVPLWIVRKLSPAGSAPKGRYSHRRNGGSNSNSEALGGKEQRLLSSMTEAYKWNWQHEIEGAAVVRRNIYRRSSDLNMAGCKIDSENGFSFSGN